jgi:hypothetical protein
MIPQNRKLSFLSIIKQRVEECLEIEDLGAKIRPYHICVGRAMYYEIALSATPFTQERVAKLINRKRCTIVNARYKLPMYLEEVGYRRVYDALCVEFDIASKPQIERVLKSEQANLIIDRMNEFKATLNNDYSAYEDLLQLIAKVPAKHVETVKTRLTPIVNMLPA